jgi:dolichol-phosphate mannosyltransferase
MQPKDLVILAPCYNEEGNIKRLLASFNDSAIKNRISRFIFIDDGSTDKSFDTIKSKSSSCCFTVTIISHTHNKGIASAFESGFREVSENRLVNEKIVITIEADNTSDISILPDLLRIIEAEYADCALASCYQNGGGVIGTGMHRIVLSKVANFLMKLRFPNIPLKTYSSFYRAYKIEVIEKLVKINSGNIFKERGFVSMVEMILLCSKYSFTMKEYPMILDTSKRSGKSKMKILSTSLGYIRLFIRSW